MVASRGEGAIGRSDVLDHALAGVAQLNADQNDVPTPRRVPPSKSGRVAAETGPQSASASRFQSPDWNDGPHHHRQRSSVHFDFTSHGGSRAARGLGQHDRAVPSRHELVRAAVNGPGRARVRLCSARGSVPGDRPRALHRPSDRGRLPTAVRCERTERSRTMSDSRVFVRVTSSRDEARSGAVGFTHALSRPPISEEVL